jgi:anaerobic magnesium-protoporphyrin IX monomethyl ester cyclase
MGGSFMNILLIDILRTSLEEVWPSAEHSLGLMYLSASLKMQFGSKLNIKIWNLISKPNRPENDKITLLEQLNDFKPDLVGIRCLSIGKIAFHETAQTVKEWNNNCLLIAGGPYPTDDAEDSLSSGYLDCIVIGEGEITFNNLVGKVLNQENWKDVEGITFRNNGNFIKTPLRPFIQDLDSLPIPDYSVIDLDRFSNQFLSFSSKISKPHANIMTTRGCPYKCAYCHNILGKNFRARSPENVLEEIQYLHNNYGITDFQIIDDIFNLDIKRAKKICDLIIQSKMELTLSFPNAIRGDRVDEELIDKMKEAGTKFISVAVETASPRLQKLIQKNLDLDKTFKAIEYIAKADIITRGFFMLGFPTETENEIEETINYAKESSLLGATFFTVVYFPGTALYKIAQSLGYYKNREYDVARDYVNVGEGPYDFSLETLTIKKKQAIREFAFTQKRLNEALRLLPNYFSQREIDGFFMAYVVSSRASLDEIKDEKVKNILRRYFVIAEKFSKKNEFYV